MGTTTKKKRVELKKYIARRGLFIRVPIPMSLKQLEPEITLARSVLDRAVLDSLEDPKIVNWFDEDDSDFVTICYIACLEPEDVIQKFTATFKRLQKGEYVDEVKEIH